MYRVCFDVLGGGGELCNEREEKKTGFPTSVTFRKKRETLCALPLSRASPPPAPGDRVHTPSLSRTHRARRLCGPRASLSSRPPSSPHGRRQRAARRRRGRHRGPHLATGGACAEWLGWWSGWLGVRGRGGRRVVVVVFSLPSLPRVSPPPRLRLASAPRPPPRNACQTSRSRVPYVPRWGGGAGGGGSAAALSRCVRNARRTPPAHPPHPPLPSLGHRLQVLWRPPDHRPLCRLHRRRRPQRRGQVQPDGRRVVRAGRARAPTARLPAGPGAHRGG